MNVPPHKSPRIIRQLSASVINKIAAGEVIERPSSVLKELLENAVDSGADRIEARLEKGGSDRVRVSDNGCGIAKEQLLLAVASHATSKIETAEDLFAVKSLGFRGEALASISEVSQMTLRSRIHDDASGYELIINGGELSPIVPCAAAPGTTVDIKNLFFNTPVRRKFMRAVQTELGHATEAFMRVALAYPHVRFTLYHNERVVQELPPVESWRDRIATLFGAELAEQLIWVESQDDSLKLSGYVANPTVSRSHNKMQYLFLNGRHIRDRSLQHALGEAYRGLLLTGRFPVSFLQFEIPPDLIDVNVHPTKLEVRFQDAGHLYSQLLQTVRSRFLAMDLTARVDAPAPPASVDVPDDVPLPNPDSASAARDAVRQWARGDADTESNAAENSARQQSSLRFDTGEKPFRPFPDAVGGGSDFGAARVTQGWQPARPRDAGGLDSGTAGREGRTHNWSSGRAGESDESWSRSARGSGSFESRVPWSGQEATARTDQVASAATPAGNEKVQALQAHNRYLVTASEEGLIVIDQHALHERVLYEQLREKVLAGRMEVQRLLTPEPVDLSPTEAAAVLEQQEVLANIGLEVEPFGGSTVVVQAYPAMLGNVNAADLLRHIAAQLEQENRLPERRDVIDELLHSMSCKAAIKAGDPLSGPEIAQLLEFRHLVQDSHHCPHGRPTTLVFSREELDRRFRRI
ncbi:MAG: DNA mismatch repair endonuclease MutL [Planctomycetales bacterium]|nr:DNA mismatch repair endonuclease MutL [Planctomycetales bacterium]